MPKIYDNKKQIENIFVLQFTCPIDIRQHFLIYSKKMFLNFVNQIGFKVDKS